jgi:hypothetical protein
MVRLVVPSVDQNRLGVLLSSAAGFILRVLDRQIFLLLHFQENLKLPPRVRNCLLELPEGKLQSLSQATLARQLHSQSNRCPHRSIHTSSWCSQRHPCVLSILARGDFLHNSRGICRCCDSPCSTPVSGTTSCIPRLHRRSRCLFL